MSRFLLILLATLIAAAQSKQFGIGRPATTEEIARINLTIYPNGKGLPKGRGTAKLGEPIYRKKCESCHNQRGEGREAQYPALAGGIGSLASAKPLKTVGSYWPYATTVFDYVRRAMPFDHPRSLSADEVYAVTAFILSLNGIVTETQELNEKTLPAVVMPNRDGFLTHPDPMIPPKPRK